jgi:poly(ADP-ribose) glycohydrolase ARH3
MPTLAEKFAGCLLGLAVGDAVGARFEGQDPAWIAKRFPTVSAFIEDRALLTYTDDTQMAIGVAETLVECSAIKQEELCRAFVANYEPWRGYGMGARRILEAMCDGEDYEQVAAQSFGGSGSFGNGAAMRVAPIGVFFHDDLDRVWREAYESALPTHRHPLGIEGAQLLAMAVALVARGEAFNRQAFFEALLDRCREGEYRVKLLRARNMTGQTELPQLGNGIAAQNSVVTAIACFSLFPDSYTETIAHCVLLGGDTDTIAAMAGAISGTYLGAQAIPPSWLERLEDEPNAKGRSYLARLADRLVGIATQRGKP